MSTGLQTTDIDIETKCIVLLIHSLFVISLSSLPEGFMSKQLLMPCSSNTVSTHQHILDFNDKAPVLSQLQHTDHSLIRGCTNL